METVGVRRGKARAVIGLGNDITKTAPDDGNPDKKHQKIHPNGGRGGARSSRKGNG